MFYSEFYHVPDDLETKQLIAVLRLLFLTPFQSRGFYQLLKPEERKRIA